MAVCLGLYNPTLLKVLFFTSSEKAALFRGKEKYERKLLCWGRSQLKFFFRCRKQVFPQVTFVEQNLFLLNQRFRGYRPVAGLSVLTSDSWTSLPATFIRNRTHTSSCAGVRAWKRFFTQSRGLMPQERPFVPTRTTAGSQIFSWDAHMCEKTSLR